MESGIGRIAEERPVVIDGGSGAGAGLALDGLFRAGRERESDGIVIAPPHPLYGGSMESPVVTEIAYAAADAGLASLRFDWRGVGGSQGEASGSFDDHADDFAAALRHLSESVPGTLCAAGYSAGAAAAVRAAAGARVTRLLLVAPPPPMLDAGKLSAFGGRILVVAGDADRIAAPDALRPLLAPLPKVRLEVLPGVDHFFGTGLGALGRIVRSWLG